MRFIRNISKAFTSLGRKRQYNAVKILCLSIGLAVGTVLIAKVYFEQSYDNFFPGAKQTYLINENIFRDGELKPFPQTSGAIAPGVKRYTPQIEAATRINPFGEATFVTADKKKLKASAVMTDSCFFDVLARPILRGNPKEVLSRPYYCMINRKLAETIGGNVVGKELFCAEYDSIKIIIGGVYEDIPRNSYLSNINIIVSLSTLKHIWNGREDGSENWIGNDRYTSFIRLRRDAKISDILPSVEKMKKENLPIKEMKKAGVDMTYTFTPLTDIHTSEPSVKKMSWIMSLLAFILIFSAVMNYLLIVIGSIVGRAKEMAVRKCYGAAEKNIHSIVFSEVLVHLILSILLAALLIFLCRGTIESLLGASLKILLFNSGSWILVSICSLILLIGGLVPGYLYAKIPVASAFRGYKDTRRRWKLLLLSVQFIAASFLVSLLFVIHKQYAMMINDDPGYSYENLATISINGVPSGGRSKIITELKKLPEVESVTSADNLLYSGQSGDNVYLPDNDKEYFNIADLYSVSDGYLSTMGIKIIEGRNFTEQTDSMKEVMVSKGFAEKMKTLAHWDNPIGKRVYITAHPGIFQICGIYDSIKIGCINNPDFRPSAMFYSKNICPIVIIKFHTLTTASMTKVRDVLKQLYPDKNLDLMSYKTLILDNYYQERDFQKTVMIGGLVTLFIALLGLIGYTNDEVNRRQKEIAIRKVNGAEITDILQLFFREIMRIAVPSLFIGGLGALLVARKWLELYSEKVSLSISLFLCSGLLLLIIILVVVYFNCRKVANNNPVNYIKGE